MRDILRSNWSIAVILAELPEFRRIDDGTDLLAFRLAGAIPRRSAYVYVYGKDPDLIEFDLEDESVETGDWDHTVRRGSAQSIAELRTVLLAWLHHEG
jgi:hypothetical protein